jgi:replicative DNA helicase
LPIDVVTVAGKLRDANRLAGIGGAAYLAQIADATPDVANVKTHADRVREKWRARVLISTCQRIAAEGYGDVGSIQEWIDEAEQDVYEIARTAESRDSVKMGEALTAAMWKITEAAARGHRITGTATGLLKLDEKIAGLHAGDLMVIAGRPGMGKSAAALDIATNVASPSTRDAQDENGYRIEESVPGVGVAVFSLEMPREQLATRSACSEGRVDLGKLRGGFMQPDDWRRLTEAAAYCSSLPIWIDDTPAISLLELRAKVRRIRSQCEREGRRFGLIVVDYLQLMRGTGKEDNREQVISGLSQGLKALAKEAEVPIIALSQLNRSVETRSTKDKRPQLSDLRECIAGDQEIVDAVTGEVRTIADIANGTREAHVYGLDTRTLKVSTAKVADAWSTGVRPVFTIRTQSGLTKNNDDKKPMYKKREGNRRAEIMKVETFNPANKKLQKTFTAKEKIGIRIQYLAHKSLPRPSVGLVFQDQLNTTIFATNNWVMKKPTRALKPGESLLMETVIDNIFTDGKYTISCAIESEDFRIIYDRIEHICSFMVGGQLLAHATTHPTHSVDITYIPATNDKPEITT